MPPKNEAVFLALRKQPHECRNIRRIEPVSFIGLRFQHSPLPIEAYGTSVMVVRLRMV